MGTIKLIDDFLIQNWIEEYPKGLRETAIKTLAIAKEKDKKKDLVTVQIDARTWKLVPRSKL